MRAGLPAFVLAQVAGILAAELGVARDAPTRELACVALVACAAATMRSLRVAVAAGMLAFFFVGLFAAQRLRVDVDEVPDWPIGVRRTLDARVEAVQSAADHVRLDLCDLAWPRREGQPLSAPGCLRLRVDTDEPGHAFFTGRRAGERVRARVTLKPLDALRNPGGVERTAALLRRGIWARASLAHPDAFVVLTQDAGASSARLGDWRAWARQRRGAAIERLLALGRGGPLLAALGLGAADRLDAGHREALARLGLSHLVAVSGLHLGMVAGLGFGLLGVLSRGLRWAGRFDPEPLQWASAALCAVGYALLCGFGTPARRALVFITLWLALHALARRPAWTRVWWWAASWVLAADSAALFELGPQLSFGITAALAGARLDDEAADVVAATVRERSVAWLRGALGVSAVALGASALILALHGRPTSVWSLGANVIAVPLTAVLLLPSALIATGLAWFSVDAPVADAVLRVLAWAPAAFETGVCAVAGWLGPLPQGVRPGLDALAAAAATCAVAVRARAVGVKVVAAWAGVAVLGWGGLLQPDDAAGEVGTEASETALEILALDVGQGDALLLRAGEVAVLVDAGWASPLGGFDAGRQVVVPALAALGVGRLDLLVLSHGDLDHRGGAGAVLDALEVDEIWVPRPMIDAPVFAALRQQAASAGTRWRGLARGDARVRVGALDLEVLWPPGDLGPASGNEASLVLRVGHGAAHVLLMGDAGYATERALLAAGASLRADVLKVGHHGSATASSAAFLRAVSPRWALVSAGCGVERALPHAASLARIEQLAERVLWTGRDGALRVGLGVGSELVRRPPIWPARRCRSHAPAAHAVASDRADSDSRGAPPGEPAALPLWGGSRRVVAPRERRRQRWGRRQAARRRGGSRLERQASRSGRENPPSRAGPNAAAAAGAARSWNERGCR